MVAWESRLETVWTPHAQSELREGKYKAVARLRQPDPSFGLATGETVSNAVEFQLHAATPPRRHEASSENAYGRAWRMGRGLDTASCGLYST